MEFMGLNEIREKYLSFFESKGHIRLPSFPLIPRNDKSILLINAGMTPLKPYFTGEETPPGPRVTTCQKCIRTPDIERVGKTSRHGTFFEMLGNFSFGDYFKREATAWAWEFITQVLKLPVEKLYVTVYQDDDEAYDIWTKEVGVDPSHVSRLGKEDNFWEIGSGPCGPCSEIYFDRGEEHGCGSPDCRPGCDCDRFVEFWNLVFTQFNNDGAGNYTPLEKKNIDTGMGLERLACIMQGVDSIFDVDTIKNITEYLSEISSKHYGDSRETDVSLRVVTDHIRSTTFMICDGILPSNEGRGYVLRRLLRRAARHGKLLGITKEHFLSELCEVVIRESKGAYPELEEKTSYIKRVLAQEEDRFNQTIDQGLSILSDMMEKARKNGDSILDGKEVFKLYDTFGFPIDLTLEIAGENGIDIDVAVFDELMEKQKETARKAVKSSDEAWKGNELFEGVEKTVFTGYESLEENATVWAIIKDGERVGTVSDGDTVTVILDKTPFYAESGGQVGDKGVIGCVNITDCKKTNGIWLHTGVVSGGTLSEGDRVCASVCKPERGRTKRNHSSAHLLQAALRKVLGEHVEQAGSYVDADIMRFDFTHFEAMTEEEINKVETLVNEEILAGDPVVIREMPIAEARKEGATALFGEKYGDIVRVVKMGEFSCELCGGTHVSNTSDIGVFKILSESGVAAGVRRIEALTSVNVLKYLSGKEKTIMYTCSVLKSNEADLVHKAENIVKENRDLEKQISALNAELAASETEKMEKEAVDINGFMFICARVDRKTENLREICDAFREKYPDSVTLLGGADAGKAVFAIGVGKDAVKKGAHGGNLIRLAAQKCQGGGGGRPDSATAGGKDISGLKDAFAAVKAALEEIK